MKQFMVVGLGRFGTSVARTLAEKGHDVLAIDKKEKKVQKISDVVTHVAQMDATDESAFKDLGVGSFEVAVIGIGENVQSNILATMILKELGVEHVVAKAKNRLHCEVLDKVGSDKIVFPEKDTGTQLANNLISS